MRFCRREPEIAPEIGLQSKGKSNYAECLRGPDRSAKLNLAPCHGAATESMRQSG